MLSSSPRHEDRGGGVSPMATSPDVPPPTPATAGSSTPATAGGGAGSNGRSTGRRRRPPSPAPGTPQRASVVTVGELHGALLDVPARLVAEPPLLPGGGVGGIGGIGGVGGIGGGGGGGGSRLWAADGLPRLPAAAGVLGGGDGGGIPREAAVLDHLRSAVSAEAGGCLDPALVVPFTHRPLLAAASTAAAGVAAARGGGDGGAVATLSASSAGGGVVAAATGTAVAALGVASRVLPERLSVGATSLAAALAGTSAAAAGPAAAAAAAAATASRPPGVVAWHWAGVRVAAAFSAPPGGASPPGGSIHVAEVAPGPAARAAPLTSPALAGVAALAYRPYASDCLAAGTTAGVVVATSFRGGPPSLRLWAMPGHTSVAAVAWAPDGSTLASAAGGPATAGPVAVVLWALAGTGDAADEAAPLRAFRGGVSSLVWAPSPAGAAAGPGTLLATAALRTAVAVYEDVSWTGGPVRGLAAPAVAAAATPLGAVLLALQGIADLGVLGGGAVVAGADGGGGPCDSSPLRCG